MGDGVGDFLLSRYISAPRPSAALRWGHPALLFEFSLEKRLISGSPIFLRESKRIQEISA